MQVMRGKKTLFNIIKEMKTMKIMRKSKVLLYIVAKIKIMYKSIEFYSISKKKYANNIWKKVSSHIVEKMKTIQKDKELYTTL